MGANPESSERAKKLLIILIIVIIIGFSVYNVLKHVLRSDGHNMVNNIMSDIQAEHFDGRVKAINYSGNYHQYKTAVLTDKRSYSIYQPWYDDIDVGDSLVKKIGTIQIIVYKPKHDTLVLDYAPMLRKMQVKGY